MSGNDEREWYHQFHGSLFPAMGVSQCGKVWLLFLPRQPITYETLPRNTPWLQTVFVRLTLAMDALSGCA